MSKPIGSDFIEQIGVRTRRCSECGKKVKAGEPMLVSIRFGKVQKCVCSEDCRLEFDNNYWQAVVREKLYRKRKGTTD